MFFSFADILQSQALSISIALSRTLYEMKPKYERRLKIDSLGSFRIMTFVCQTQKDGDKTVNDIFYVNKKCEPLYRTLVNNNCS